ncbi:TIGR04282 family arsenosugar biosynthesis glycosyltransferase [Aromatoleum bremense]|uniref:DUF2064 domain-containing protein n=1 Tax=Aromatoleum bremense TaxID=76115 RepID=A0ABX1NT65_9RHOO|nr:TIGR04282 family arsenosugar biosynthesis glycosyltransferase [Aromatoleum bremense]NMG14732.1 DUF2064 domain-containing protein [Aromatoleum bremense]QTQ30995.1 Transferase I, rSAM/selenodomain-associated family protein [Aromatoleum bremense]
MPAEAATAKPVRILVFAKAPRPGFAKTRLIPALGAAGAAALARRMLDDTLAAAVAAAVGPVELVATPPICTRAWSDVALPAGIAVTDQGEGDLGRRMARAVRRTAERGEAALLIGTDCVDLSPAVLRAAAAALRTHDAVIHPSTDGGYVLLGLARFSPQLFSDIAWSTETVAAVTITRLCALGWSLHVGKAMHDIDVADDLRHVPAGRADGDGPARQ